MKKVPKPLVSGGWQTLMVSAQPHLNEEAELCRMGSSAVSPVRVSAALGVGAEVSLVEIPLLR